MLPPVADNSVLSASIQPAVIEAMGNIGAAVAAKILFLSADGTSVSMASGKFRSGGAQPVAAANSSHDAEPSSSLKALQQLYDQLRSTLVSAVDSEENKVSRSPAIRRLENVNGHLQEFTDEEIM